MKKGGPGIDLIFQEIFKVCYRISILDQYYYNSYANKPIYIHVNIYLKIYWPIAANDLANVSS